MARALDRAARLVQLALDEWTVVVRAAILDRIQRAGAVEHADLEVLPFDQADFAWLQVLDGAHFDDLGHGLNPSAEIGFAAKANPPLVNRHASRSKTGPGLPLRCSRGSPAPTPPRARARRPEHLQRQQRALHPRRGDVDPEQLEQE